MITSIIMGSALGTVTGRAVDKAIDSIMNKGYSNVGGDITWQSTPNHDGWGPDAWSSAADWIAWYHALVEKYGADEAGRIWANEYDKSTYGAAEINYAVKNEEFKQFIQSTGLAEKSTILSKVFRAENSIDKAIEPISDLYKGIGNVVSGTGNALSKTGDGLDNLGNLLKWLPWIAAGLALVFAFIYFKPFAKTAKAA